MLVLQKTLHFLKLFEISENIVFIENWFPNSKKILGFKICSEFRKMFRFHNSFKNFKKYHIFVICLEF